MGPRVRTRGAWPRLVALLLAATVCAPLPAVARRHAGELATGLPGIRLAQTPPDFTFDGQDGPQRFHALFGRPIVLSFWATWCAPCQSEISAFAEMEKVYGDGVPFVAVSEDTTPGAAEAYLRAHHIRAISVDDPDRKIFGLYTVVPIPTTLVLWPDGAVAHVSVGALDWDELRTAIERVRPGSLTLPGSLSTMGGNAGTPDP